MKKCNKNYERSSGRVKRNTDLEERDISIFELSELLNCNVMPKSMLINIDNNIVIPSGLEAKKELYNRPI